MTKTKVHLFDIQGSMDTVVPTETNSGLVKTNCEALAVAVEVLVPDSAYL